MENRGLTLSELAFRIRGVVSASFSETLWVKAEINTINHHSSGHCYLEFVELHPDTKQELSRMRGMIWSDRYAVLRAKFQEGAQRPLGAHIQVLVGVRVDYHVKFGIALHVVDIDPAYTVGAMAQKRAQTLLRLQQEGLVDRNKQVALRTLPRRIALVSSSNAAGYGDFMKQTEAAAQVYGFQIALYNVVLQGKGACVSMVSALRAIWGQRDRFDAVVLVRGGGASLDLSVFDEYDLVRAIALFPLPVLTGIGHDRDSSLSDLVAYQSFKTPTAVGEFLVQRFDGQRALLLEHGVRIGRALEKGVSERTSHLQLMREQASRHLERTLSMLRGGLPDVGRIGYAVSSHLERQFGGLRELSLRGSAGVQHGVQACEYSLGLIESKVPELSPWVNMQRGYVLVQRDGVLVSSVGDVSRGDVLELCMGDGVLAVEVLGEEAQ